MERHLPGVEFLLNRVDILNARILVAKEGLEDACKAIAGEWGCDIYCGEHCPIFRAICEITEEGV